MDTNSVNDSRDFKTGSTQGFDNNWKSRKEAHYNHWTPGPVKNQIQLAFRRHWLLFKEILALDKIASGDCIEVGCGRGSISSYFAENSFKCTLLDYSESVLETAKAVFHSNGHQADFVHGDANQLPFKDGSFDVAVSIGLLEHFQDVGKPIAEQVRVLRSGGRFFGYIVPERPDNIQKYFNWINKGLKLFVPSNEKAPKDPIFRSEYEPEHYLAALHDLPVRDVEVLGMYPLPMVSHSPEFPFSLLPPRAERLLTLVFRASLAIRRFLFRKNPWTCSPSFGQAFLLTFRKL